RPAAGGPMPLSLIGGTGLPGDEYRFEGDLPNTLGAVTAGTHYALITATDPEDSDPAQPTYHFGVDPNTLAADASRALAVRGYGVVPITVTGYGGWVTTIHGPDRGYFSDLAVGSSGEVYVASYVFGAIELSAGPCSSTPPTGFGSDALLCRFDSSGNLDWAHRFSGSRSDSLVACGLGPDGTVWVSGITDSPDTDWDPGPGVKPFDGLPGQTQAFVAGYSPRGEFLAGWKLGVDALSYDSDLDVSPTGAVYARSRFVGTDVDFDPGPGQALFSTVANTHDLMLCQFDATGVLGWARRFECVVLGGIAEQANTLKAMNDGGVLIGGLFSNTFDLDPTAGVDSRVDLGWSDAWLTRLGSAGDYRWGGAWGGEDYDGVDSVAEGPGTQIAVISHFSGTVDFDPGPGTQVLTVPLAEPWTAISSFTGMGSFERVGAVLSNGAATDCAVDGSGRLIVSGWFQGTVDFDPGPGEAIASGMGANNPFFLMLNSDGSYATHSAWNVTGSLIPRTIGVTPDTGKLVAAGTYAGMPDFHPGLPEVIRQTEGFNDMFLMALSPNGTW
ncbi:MAG: hypothetical protein ABI743_14305, partial [bacterium]